MTAPDVAGLAQLIERRATLAPADIAIAFRSTTIDGKQLWRATLAMAGKLRRLGTVEARLERSAFAKRVRLCRQFGVCDDAQQRVAHTGRQERLEQEGGVSTPAAARIVGDVSQQYRRKVTPLACLHGTGNRGFQGG